MVLHAYVTKIETLTTTVVNKLILSGYDTEPVTNGITSGLKDNIGEWLDTHAEPFVSWTGTKEPPQRYTLYAKDSNWYIDLHDSVYPDKIKCHPNTLQTLAFTYGEMRKEYESSRLLTAVTDIVTDTHYPVDLSEKESICSNISINIRQAATNIEVACHAFLDYFIAVNDISSPCISIDNINLVHSIGEVAECVTPLGDFVCDKSPSDIVFFSPPGSYPINISNMHTTLKVDNEKIHMLSSAISNAFNKYNTVYTNNEAWMLLASSIARQTTPSTLISKK